MKTIEPRSTQFQKALNMLCELYADIPQEDMTRALQNKINEIEKV